MYEIFCKYSYDYYFSHTSDYYFPHTSDYYFPHTIKEVFKEVFKEYTTHARDLLFILEEVKKRSIFTYILLFYDLLLELILQIDYHQSDISTYNLQFYISIVHSG